MNEVTAYFDLTADTPSGLAAKCGVPASTITRALRGERQPSFGLASKVESATGGRITAKSFMEVCFDASQKPEVA